MGSPGQSIYYAESVAAAAANTVTVAFNSSGQARNPDVRIAEYAGVRASDALDAISSGDGMLSLDMDSGGLVTPAANDLLVVASCVASQTEALPGFEPRPLSAPN